VTTIIIPSLGKRKTIFDQQSYYQLLKKEFAEGI
jgi:hypothetical protein